MTNSDWNNLRLRYKEAQNQMMEVEQTVREYNDRTDSLPVFIDGSNAYRFRVVEMTSNRFYPDCLGELAGAPGTEALRPERFEELKETVRGIKV
jgi:hypothetical protein